MMNKDDDKNIEVKNNDFLINDWELESWEEEAQGIVFAMAENASLIALFLFAIPTLIMMDLPILLSSVTISLPTMPIHALITIIWCGFVPLVYVKWRVKSGLQKEKIISKNAYNKIKPSFTKRIICFVVYIIGLGIFILSAFLWTLIPIIGWIVLFTGYLGFSYKLGLIFIFLRPDKYDEEEVERVILLLNSRDSNFVLHSHKEFRGFNLLSADKKMEIKDKIKNQMNDSNI